MLTLQVYVHPTGEIPKENRYDTNMFGKEA